MKILVVLKARAEKIAAALECDVGRASPAHGGVGFAMGRWRLRRDRLHEACTGAVKAMN